MRPFVATVEEADVYTLSDLTKAEHVIHARLQKLTKQNLEMPAEVCDSHGRHYS
jgi:hypothetical protein